MKTKMRVSLLGYVCLSLVSADLRAGGVVGSPDEASLRAALAGGGTVTFDCDGTIALADSLRITNGTSLDASGHSISLSGGNAVRVLWVETNVLLTLKNLTIANGFSTNAGAGIYIDGGTVDMISCVLRSNLVAGAAGMPGGNGTNGLDGTPFIPGVTNGGQVLLEAPAPTVLRAKLEEAAGSSTPVC